MEFIVQTISIFIELLLIGVPIVCGSCLGIHIYFKKFSDTRIVNSIFLDKKYTEKLNQICKKENIKRNELITGILESYIDHYEENYNKD